MSGMKPPNGEPGVLSSKPRAINVASAFVPPRSQHPSIRSARSVYSYERLNQIEEGSYGVVFRAREKATGDIVALKKLKLEEEKNGFPITALREIRALMSCRHENVVRIREVVVGDTLTQCVKAASAHINLLNIYDLKSFCRHGLH
jgi:cell division cycle 2-like